MLVPRHPRRCPLGRPPYAPLGGHGQSVGCVGQILTEQSKGRSLLLRLSTLVEPYVNRALQKGAGDDAKERYYRDDPIRHGDSLRALATYMPLSAMSSSRRPHLPTLAIGLSLFIAIGWLLQPSREVLYLLAFVVMAVVVEVTYRRIDDASGRST